MMNYYPLALQNEWQYKQKDGSTYTNKIVSATGSQFTMHNSAANSRSIIKTDGTLITTDALEAGNFQPWLTNDLQKGDNWVVKFKANGLSCLLLMTVYTNVLMVEAENKIMVNDSLMPLDFFTQYFYADGGGLILTTSAAGDVHALIDYKLN
jgi:hypothetical protein